jgi:hypothetical protein
MVLEAALHRLYVNRQVAELDPVGTDDSVDIPGGLALFLHSDGLIPTPTTGAKTSSATAKIHALSRGTNQ